MNTKYTLKQFAAALAVLLAAAFLQESSWAAWTSPPSSALAHGLLTVWNVLTLAVCIVLFFRPRRFWMPAFWMLAVDILLMGVSLSVVSHNVGQIISALPRLVV